MIDLNEEYKQALKGKKFIDLFCGLGGFRLALESYGAKCVFSSDIDNHVSKVYEKNFGDNPLSDITKVDEKKFLSMIFFVLDFHVKHFQLVANKRGLKIQEELYLEK